MGCEMSVRQRAARCHVVVTFPAANENPFHRLGFSFDEPDVLNSCIACHGFHSIRSNFALISNAVELQYFPQLRECFLQACRGTASSRPFLLLLFFKLFFSHAQSFCD